MDFLEKRKAVYKSFKNLYKKVLYLDQEVGRQEKQYIHTVPYQHVTEENGIKTVNVVYDKPDYDPEIYIKLPGIILIYQYGGIFNEKHKSTEIYIYKDSDYIENEPASIKDVLEKLEEHMINNQKMIYQKINKKISNGYREDAYTVKYKMIDFFDKKYIKEMTICNLDITMDDIYKISTFKDIRAFKTDNCRYKDDVSLRFLNIKHYKDYRSKLKSLNMFNHVNFDVFLDGTFFANELDKSLKLNCEYLQMIDLDLDYSKFFLLTDFHKVKSINIDNTDGNYFLNSREANLLSCFYKVSNMSLNAYVDNFDFIYKLPYLKEFRGNLKINDDKSLESVRKERQKFVDMFLKENKDYDIKRYLKFQKMLIELERKKLYDKITVPRIAETKWRAIIEEAAMNDDIDDVKKRLLAIKQLPQKEREMIGTEDEVIFFDANIKNSYQKLGIELALSNDDNNYASILVGPYGNKLYREKQYFDCNKLPVIGPKGKRIAIIEYQRDHYEEWGDYTVKRVHENIVSNDNIFNNYYNSHFNTEKKLEYLEEKLNNLMIKDGNQRTLQDIKKRTIQKRVENIISAKLNKIFWNNFFLSSDTENKNTVLDVLLENKNIDSINKYIEEEALEKHWDKETKEVHLEQLNNCVVLHDKKERLLKTKPLLSILDEYMESNQSLTNVLSALKNINAENWFLKDIDEFTKKFDLNMKQKELIQNYILYLQENNKKEIEDELSRLYDEEEYMSYHGYHLANFFSDKSLEEQYQEGTISENVYNNAIKFNQTCERISMLRDRPSVVDIARIHKYYELIDVIDTLSTSDLSKLKETITITDYFEDKFDKYCDHLIYAITGEYPDWISLELAKRPKLPKKQENVTHRNYVPKQKTFVKGYSRLITNPLEM